VSIFLTGFPGFLGSALVERLLDRTDRIDCLVQPQYLDTARDRAADIAGDDWSERIGLYEGDITDPGLGLDDPTRAEIEARTREVFHLAAAYDLDVPRAVGEAVNVEGTRNVLEFADGCPELRRFQYVSTCYVSGRHDGVFGPEDLDVNQSFTNHYEATKFEAERLVRERSAAGLPTTIYRPAIVVGDSETGATDKYDGPYGLLSFLLRQPRRLAVLPRALGGTGCEVNLVPRDFVVDAIDHLGALDRSVDTTYQLCDPNPSTVGQTIELFGRATGRRIVPVPLPSSLIEGSLRHVPGLERATGVDPATVPYFDHPTSYVAPNTRRDLAGTDIECPPLSAYVETLVAYLRANPGERTTGQW
jgi:thioester reductase-like protein